MAAKKDFTDRFLRSIKPAEPGKRVIYMDAVVPQFGLRVGDKSTKDNIGAFVLVARWPGGSKNPAPRRIGDYPITSLAEAREIAREWREDIRQGIDPKVKEEQRRCEEELRRKEEANAQANTFSAVFEDYRAECLSRIKTGEAATGDIKRHVIPKWGPRPIAEIRRADVKALIREIDKVAPRTSSLILSYLKTFFSWATDEERIEANPAAGIKPLSSAVKRDRVLSDAEIRAFWIACGDLGAFGRAFRFLLATGQRLSEVGDMQWREVDVEARRWAIPRERAKADRAHEVPLSDLALATLGECPRLGPFPFTTRGDIPIAGWSKSKVALDVAMLAQLQKDADEKGETAPVTLPDWRLHDLRRTCATNLARLGVDRIVISKLLNHSEGGVTSIYDRHARDAEKRAAMDRWAERLKAIVEGDPSTNVVSLASARR